MESARDNLDFCAVLQYLFTWYKAGNGLVVESVRNRPEYADTWRELKQIARRYRADPTLTDGTVGLALGLLATNPEGDVQHDALARARQLELRLLLSLNDYSRDEVRQALRKVRKSVDRHTRVDGRRGYLDFICRYLPA